MTKSEKIYFMDIKNLESLSKRAQPGTKKLFEKLKKARPSNLDEVTADLNDEIFERIDCLTCANCCKTTSPIFYEKDVERLAKHFKIRPAEFVEKYLHKDEDNDYVLNAAPCPFLAPDNYCMVYEHRPNACREYPHLKRKRFYQLLDLAIKNTAVCPAVYEAAERLKNIYR